MRLNRKYFLAVVLLAVLAVVFGLAGTVAPPLAEEVKPSESSSSSSSSVAHFQNPPSYDSGWVNITSKCGQYVTLKHGLNTTDVVVDITGKQSLDPMGGSLAWGKTYGGTDLDYARSVVQTSDGGYAIAGYTNSFGALGYDFWLVKTDSAGNTLWNRTYGGTGNDYAVSVVQTGDCGYALAGYTYSFGVGTPTYPNFWLVKTDPDGNKLWSQTYGGAGGDYAFSLVQTSDGGYALAGSTLSYGAAHDVYPDCWLVKTDIESGLAWTGLTGNSITLYRGMTDPYWSYVRVRIWTIKEPTWIYGDINMDGVVDVKDLYIVSRNYGKTFSLLSVSGIAFIAGIQTYKTRKKKHN